MAQKMKVSPEILQGFRDWKRMHMEKFNYISKHWLSDDTHKA